MVACKESVLIIICYNYWIRLSKYVIMITISPFFIFSIVLSYIFLLFFSRYKVTNGNPMASNYGGIDVEEFNKDLPQGNC